VLRRELEKVGAIYKVTKNTFSKKAIDQLNIDSAVKGMFTGITGIVFCTDYVAASKVLAKFSKENEIFKIKGGFIENKHFTMAQIKEISMLESKQQLIGKLVYILNQPLTKLVVQLSKPVKDVVCVLSAIEDKKK
jgi:large subunit ribosomal protein L10